MTTPDAPLVLIVDDLKDNREMYAEFLAYFGYRVAEAADGAEALDKTLRLHPALIVMDLSMPGIDGWEATRRIKHDARTRNIPVVALTAFVTAGNLEAVARVRDAGCDALLSKPCLPEDLAAEISRLLVA